MKYKYILLVCQKFNYFPPQSYLSVIFTEAKWPIAYDNNNRIYKKALLKSDLTPRPRIPTNPVNKNDEP